MRLGTTPCIVQASVAKPPGCLGSNIHRKHQQPVALTLCQRLSEIYMSHLPQRPPQRASTSRLTRISTTSQRLGHPWHSKDRVV
jgi:hypothetical protein